MVTSLLDLARGQSRSRVPNPKLAKVQATRPSLAAMLAGITACYVSERCCCRKSC